MLSFSQLDKRLRLLMEDLDGEYWTSILEQLNPPEKFPKHELVHDLCFRDAKALAGYIPDLRATMRNNAPKSLSEEEILALRSVRGILNFSARLPVLILLFPQYVDNENLINVYNGYRQTLKELDEYLALATSEA
ncbi:MAG: hypothetical protein LBE80_05775 [Deltaproteobacteria bacterium]|jgi:hypothetical protein|nr:hypothetical protein [Deltaproteobacteria bacterium]